MSTDREEYLNAHKYRVMSVEKTDPPEGMPAGDWYRYIIGQDGTQIEGFKPGSLEAVTRHAETVAENLNERAASGGKSVYAVHKRK